jgi:teichuronic acid exporter
MISDSENFITNFIWQVFGNLGYYIISLIGNIVLARLLGAYEFGIIGILLFFIMISRVFTESGLSGALIRKGNPSDEDYSTIFIFNICISVFLFLLVWFLAPYISLFYENNHLALYLRVISVIFVINAFKFTQNTRLIVQLDYKKISYYTTTSMILGTSIGVVLAFLDFGVWSLIAMQISNALILTIIFWTKEGGYSNLVFNNTSFKGMYKFGLYTTLSNLIGTIFENIYQLILGKYFSISTTGYYFQGKKLQEIPVGILKNTTTGVVYSALSKVGHEGNKFDKIYTSIGKLFTAIVGLVCLNLYLFSTDIVILLYGENWIESSFYIRVLSIASFFYMQEMLNRNIFKVFDKTDSIFKLELIKKAIQIVSIIIGLYYLDIKILMYGYVVVSAISFLINYSESRKIFSNSKSKYFELWIAIKVFLIFMILVFLFEKVLLFFELKPLYRVLIFCPILSVTFLGILHSLKVVNIKSILTTIRQFKK